METQAKIQIPEKDIDEDIKKELAKLKRKIKSLEGKIKTRDSRAQDLETKIENMGHKVASAITLSRLVCDLIEITTAIKEQAECNDGCGYSIEYY
jgi:predicted  nucleic acid-binding Zn-ribbon protein